jgi:phosphocarrier protein FPr
MILIDEKDIKLNAEASDKSNAIILAGNLLYENGYIKREYIESMLKREKQATTYLANGIAIPHGCIEDKDCINETGIVILQFKNGIKWDNENIVYIVVGIAAKNDEHIGVLANLTKVVQNKDVAELLRETDAPNVVIEKLSVVTKVENNGITINPEDFPLCLDVAVKGEHGLHARPATNLIEQLKKFNGEVYIEHKGNFADAHNLISILSLGVERDNDVRVYIRGEDADKISEYIKAFLEETDKSLEQTEDIERGSRIIVEEYNYTSQEIITGIVVNKGIAIGPICKYKQSENLYRNDLGSPAQEWKKIKDAMIKARRELLEIRENTAEKVGKTFSGILDTQLSILEDEHIIKKINALIRDEESAVDAWQTVIDDIVKSLASSDSKYISERKLDIEDLKNRVIRILVGDNGKNFNVEEPSILITSDLYPTDIEHINENIIAIALSKGSESSHASILINALDIPLIVSCGDEILKFTEGTLAILDSIKGCIVVNPSEDDLALAKSIQKIVEEQKEKERFSAYEPAITIDKKRIEIKANIAKSNEVLRALDKGAEGVGLLRTEFLYLNRTNPPSFDELYSVYVDIAEKLRGLPLTIRLLDIGGDKKIGYIKQEIENNPFLGIRGIRLLLENRNILADQINAIVKAAVDYPIRLLIPMVTFYEELEEIVNIVEEAKKRFVLSELKVGIMVEVPSAALLSDILVEKVDFFSIGTNDLTQYVLAIDRTNPKLAKQSDPLHPAVLRLIKYVVESAHKEGKEVSICGEVASDIQALPFLIGLGVNELSVNLQSIQSVKFRTRELNYIDCRDIAEMALRCKTANEVRELSVKLLNNV